MINKRVGVCVCVCYGRVRWFRSLRPLCHRDGETPSSRSARLISAQMNCACCPSHDHGPVKTYTQAIDRYYKIWRVRLLFNAEDHTWCIHLKPKQRYLRMYFRNYNKPLFRLFKAPYEQERKRINCHYLCECSRLWRERDLERDRCRRRLSRSLEREWERRFSRDAERERRRLRSLSRSRERDLETTTKGKKKWPMLH